MEPGLVDPETVTAWLALLRDLGFGFTAAGVLFIWALYTRKIVWGIECERERREKEEWKHAALSGTGILEKLVERIEARRL
jgi:hypothetical protein